ncbi:hypothetical protein J7438_11875 [Thalassotalea sp. G20_0]|nr:hypothetical protein [Thalassotalea sp. G20_0]
MQKIKTNAIPVLLVLVSDNHFFIQSGVIVIIQSNRLNRYGKKHQEARISDLMNVRTADSSALRLTLIMLENLKNHSFLKSEIKHEHI